MRYKLLLLVLVFNTVVISAAFKDNLKDTYMDMRKSYTLATETTQERDTRIRRELKIARDNRELRLLLKKIEGFN